MFVLDTPDTTLDAYWATAAQILAVLSLAVVVEARAVQRQWSGVPAWIQLAQGVLWASILVAAAFLLPSALEASRPDRSHPDWMPGLTQSVIRYSVAILMLSPALLFLVAGSAESYYAAKELASPTRWRAWQHLRKSRRLLKRAQGTTGNEPATREEIAQLVAVAEDIKRRARSASQERAKARAARFRSYFTPPESGEGTSPKA